jgi:hypothetical protein
LYSVQNIPIPDDKSHEKAKSLKSRRLKMQHTWQPTISARARNLKVKLLYTFLSSFRLAKELANFCIILSSVSNFFAGPEMRVELGVTEKATFQH